ncbi:hypothetical protein COJ46_09750 [Bacillus sp. AFS077874]|uniref:hypothetical protein n=1 Tax=Bacillus sp. AFS077874 TaxID=2033513 RepID=UPI000BFA3B6D|nr:hypothetical protein [Bacillus sp. AFS077874]PFM81193.1 hypothetical protein COJ46_09750 [Bacillus sp. AFS077874]
MKKNPIQKDKIEKPVNIYKNSELLQECQSIQEAGRYLKIQTGDKYFRFAQIEKGYIYGDSWSFKGATYTFTTDENFRLKRKAELEDRQKEKFLSNK